MEKPTTPPTDLKDDFEYSKWERARCSHGRFYYQRWRWKKGQTIEDSYPEIKSNKCKICFPEDRL